MINKGTYKVTVTEAVLSESKNGTPSIKLKLQLEGGETIYHDIWLSDAAFARSIETLKEVFSFNGNFEALQNLIGCECEAVIEQETFEGKERDKVKWINPVGGRVLRGLDGDRAQALARKLGLKAKPLLGDNNQPF